MDVITHNFFCLLRSGALGEHEPIEPMSAFKWRRLCQMVHAQHVENVLLKGIRNYESDYAMNMPKALAESIQHVKTDIPAPHMCNPLLNRRLKRIVYKERHAIDTNVEAMEVLGLITTNMSAMLNKGIMLGGIIQLGSYLRERGDKVDFVKLEHWLNKLHLRRMAQLQGSMLMAVLHFDQDELPFVTRVETSAYRLVLRSVLHTAEDTAEEWHFRQSKAGFLQNNSALLRRNLRRSLRYFVYAPIETVSNFFHNFARSLQEIEE